MNMRIKGYKRLSDRNCAVRLAQPTSCSITFAIIWIKWAKSLRVVHQNLRCAALSAPYSLAAAQLHFDLIHTNNKQLTDHGVAITVFTACFAVRRPVKTWWELCEVGQSSIIYVSVLTLFTCMTGSYFDVKFYVECRVTTT